MLKKKDKEIRLKIRHARIRKKLVGDSKVPRLSIHKSSKNIYTQIIDDDCGKTLVSASTLEKAFRNKFNYGGNIKAATELGLILAEKAKQKGITRICFDRGGYIYHGRIKALAETARKAGLIF